MTSQEMAALFFGINGLVIGIGTVVGNLWGNKKERTIATKTATEEANKAAAEVRRDLQEELAVSRDEVRKMREEQKADWVKFFQEKTEMMRVFQEMQVQAAEARGALALAEERVVSVKALMQAQQAQIIAQQSQIETLNTLMSELKMKQVA